jgi:hypothetical protein
MNAKEKAKDLVDKYMNPFNRNGCISPAEIIYEETAKQCALIAVDEILLACALETKGKFEYYFEVKQEINKL